MTGLRAARHQNLANGRNADVTLSMLLCLGLLLQSMPGGEFELEPWILSKTISYTSFMIRAAGRRLQRTSIIIE